MFDVVGEGFDCVDDSIVEGVVFGDVVVMFDILLVGCCFEKGVRVLLLMGWDFIEENIGDVLVICELYVSLCELGEWIGGFLVFVFKDCFCFFY